MAYLIFTKLAEAEAAQAKRDIELGYPESLDSFRWVGGGRHCPKEFGRAYHYCAITKSDKEEKWAVLDAGQTPDEPGAIKMDELPEDWFSEIIM